MERIKLAPKRKRPRRVARKIERRYYVLHHRDNRVILATPIMAALDTLMAIGRYCRPNAAGGALRGQTFDFVVLDDAVDFSN
jgi:hypothetical protein